MGDKIADSWNRESDEYFNVNASEAILSRIQTDPSWAFPPPIYAMLKEGFPQFAGLRVLVPSSGDNGAAFAFHLLGAEVTSADIAERQLYNARQIAQRHGWEMEFVCADSMRLTQIGDGLYDLVYTSNGVHVWINDLMSMYRSFNRVLKPGGRYMMFETHPFIRPFDDSSTQVRIVKPYEVTSPRDGDLTYAWRVQDLMNSLIASGFSVDHMEEFHSGIGSFDLWWFKTLEEAEADGNAKFDWTKNPWAALPQWIGLSTTKTS